MIDFVFINSPYIVFFICSIAYIVFLYFIRENGVIAFFSTFVFAIILILLCSATERKIKIPYLNKTHTVEVKKKTVITCVSYYKGAERAYQTTNELVVNGNALYLLERKIIDFYYKDGNIVRFDTKNCTGRVDVEKSYIKLK